MPSRRPPRLRRASLLGAALLAVTTCLPLAASAAEIAPDRPPALATARVTSSDAVRWVESDRDTALYAAPEVDARLFTDLPQWNRLRLLGTVPGWAEVYYEGDLEGRAPGLAWVPTGDVGPAEAPARWYLARHPAALRHGPSGRAWPIATLAPGVYLEPLGQEAGLWVRVRTRGAGWDALPRDGWVALDDLVSVAVPAETAAITPLPGTLPDAAYVDVPYRSQLDGSAYEAANCGPTVLQMGLAALGLRHSNGWLRQQVGRAQDWSGDDAGSNIWALAAVARMNGAEPLGLFDGPARLGRDIPLHRWSLDDLRRQLAAGRPVLVQVSYRALPGREEVPYFGDHFVVLAGYDPAGFTYNDPIDRDGPGADRRIGAEALDAAMRANQEGVDHAAFALAPGQAAR